MNASAPNAALSVGVEQAKRLELSLGSSLLWVTIAAGAFSLAYGFERTPGLIVVYLFALVQLSSGGSWRRAFYSGLAAGFVIAALWLTFFWQIFSAAAISLWLTFSFWLGLFTLLSRVCRSRFRSNLKWLLLPFIWCGLEYFRSELYFLRFSWLTPGFAFSANPSLVPLGQLGVYGLGFALMCIAGGAAFLWQTSRVGATCLLLGGMMALRLWGWITETKQYPQPAACVQVAGVQLEFPKEKQVCVWLNELVKRHPEAQLLVLSEYTFDSPIPESVKTWCREHKRYVIVGGKEPVGDNNFYNTAFVIAPSGEVIFRQTKAVPIQFFKDGLPAPNQAVWESPWGKIGICICYDLSYTRVTDRLVREGARLIVAPTMDVEDWGNRQHELHARIAPIRAAEYRIPIFRLASSGISQAVEGMGRVAASAPFPGQGSMLAAKLALPGPGRLPSDRWLAPLSCGVSAVAIVAPLGKRIVATVGRKPRLKRTSV